MNRFTKLTAPLRSRAGPFAQALPLPVFVLMLMTAAVFVPNVSMLKDGWPSLLIMLTAFVLLGHWISLLIKGGSGPLFLLSVVVLLQGLALPALFEIHLDRYPFGARSTGFVGDASIITFLGVTAYVVARDVTLVPLRAVRGSPASLVQPRSETRGPDRSVDRSVFVLRMAAILTLMFGAYVYARFGAKLLFSTRATQSIVGTAEGFSNSDIGLYQNFGRGLGLGLLAVICLIQKGRGLRSAPVLTWVLVIIDNLILNFPLALPRYQLFALLFTPTLILAPRELGSWGRRLSILSPLATYIVFPILQQINRSTRDFNFSTLYIPNISDYMVTPDLDGFQSICNVAMLVSQEGLKFGLQFLSCVFFFVPRALWEAKAQPTGVIAAKAAGYTFLNVSMPLPGEFYADGGWLAVLVGMALFGVMVAKLDTAFRDPASIWRRPAVYLTAVIVAGHMPILLRGSLLGVIGSPAVAVATILIWRTSTFSKAQAMSGPLVRPSWKNIG